MLQIPQSTAREFALKMYDSTTKAEATGKTVSVTIRKAGGAYANPAAGATTATEVANGTYCVTLAAADCNTPGDLIVRGAASGCDPCERLCAVVSASTGGLANLDAAVATRVSSSEYASGQATLTGLIGSIETGSGFTEEEKDELLTQAAKIGTGRVTSISPVAAMSGETEFFKGATFSGGATYSFAFESQDTLAQATTFLSLSDLNDDKLVDIQAASVANVSGNEWMATFAVAAADTTALTLGKPVRVQIAHVPSGEPGRPVAKGKGVVVAYYKGQA